MTSKKPIPKSRQSIINKKRAERLVRRREQEQEDFSKDFKNLFKENIIRAMPSKNKSKTRYK